ncbi:MAG: alpha/beta fold hydrolase [Acidimicrobiales bacterium]
MTHPRPAFRSLGAVALIATASLAIATAACSSSSAPTTKPAGASSSSTTLATTSISEQAVISQAFSSPRQRSDSTGTIWLCRPGLANDPCAGDIQVTSVDASGAHELVPGTSGAGADGMKKVDCYYVYPTVSEESGENADLTVQSNEIGTARLQAAQFSRDCNVWAPMYRQVTVGGLSNPGDAAGPQLAFRSALAGFEDYLDHFNNGRPVVLIGHSQGAAMVIRLLQATMDKQASLRKLLVSAIILGGNVVVPTGKLVGGSFQHIPPCRSATQTGCVIAYSSFLQTPPSDTLFGKAGEGVSFLSGQTQSAGLQVVCTNPASLGGGTGSLLPIFTNGPSYVEYPDLYSASCKHVGDTTWLQVNIVARPGDTRPTVTEQLGPQWGLHLYDVNMSLGNLVQVVADEIDSFG